MSNKESRIEKVTVAEGYNLWADSYDETANPVVYMDSRYTLDILAPQSSEMILDAGCGTGRNLPRLRMAKSNIIGIDFSAGMLKVAAQKNVGTPLVLADLQKPLPFIDNYFDAILCALVGEHIENLTLLTSEFLRILKEGGRLIFSVYHPQMAARGIEANFEKEGVEYRLGAHCHTVTDYLAKLQTAGFTNIQNQEFYGDEMLTAKYPKAAKYLHFPMLMVVKAFKQ